MVLYMFLKKKETIFKDSVAILAEGKILPMIEAFNKKNVTPLSRFLSERCDVDKDQHILKYAPRAKTKYI